MSYSTKEIEKTLLDLNYRLTSRALNFWKGTEAPHHDPYDGFYDIVEPRVIKKLRPSGTSTRQRQRVFHSLLGHYLQSQISPYENELFTLMRGAAAHVDGEKIYFKDTLSWCQKRSNLQKRKMIEKESSSLCKFLMPFAIEYCCDKKQVDYEAYVSELPEILRETDTLYFEAMEAWAKKSLGVPLRELNRFDAIYLLGLGEFDHLFPNQIPMSNHLDFFDQWEIKVKKIPGLVLDTNHSPKKGAQAMSFALRIPDEIHVVMNPQGGWIDLETLFHEMGHALGHTFTSPDLSSWEKDFFTSNTLSETYSFLLQNMCFSPLFLERQLGLSSREIEEISFYKVLKDLSVFRRYVGKFLAEFEMFKKNEIADGEIYAQLLEECTGFSYRPETHLFDLVPEFYALDYVISWMAEATMEKALVQTLGHDWMFKPEAGKILKDWWWCGNQYELDEFFINKGIGPIDHRDIVERWRRNISGGDGDANHSPANDNVVVSRSA
ncbi:MAG: hypothetical protein JRE24_12195 [Deltaproteobacteria bacterium]|nr:hypothetical protein [Deltaproteobacteria bacterium]